MHQVRAVLQMKKLMVSCACIRDLLDTALDRNDMCLVLKLTDGRFSGIFGGDISSEVEKKLVNEYGDGLSVDFTRQIIMVPGIQALQTGLRL